jgi:hypothetical protein
MIAESAMSNGPTNLSPVISKHPIASPLQCLELGRYGTGRTNHTQPAMSLNSLAIAAATTPMCWKKLVTYVISLGCSPTEASIDIAKLARLKMRCGSVQQIVGLTSKVRGFGVYSFTEGRS